MQLIKFYLLLVVIEDKGNICTLFYCYALFASAVEAATLEVLC